jgi:hypothetical protein
VKAVDPVGVDPPGEAPDAVTAVNVTGCPNFEEPGGAADKLVTVTARVIVNGLLSLLAVKLESPANEAVTV